MLFGYGSDNQLAAALFGEGRIGLSFGAIKQFSNLWPVERADAIEIHESIRIPAALQERMRIGQGGAMVETEVHPFRICSKRAREI
jgi:hypothetical protein